MYEPRQKVLWFAITSRLTVMVLQFIFNIICPDHDADAFRSPRRSSESISIYDKAVDHIFGGLTRWDAQYFIHIAKYGYTYENTLVFFPLYPASIRFLGMILQKLLFGLNNHSVITIAAVLINFGCFVKSAVIFYDISKRVLGHTVLAYKASILYCINPASIFFTAAYSESMFAYITFYSMLAALEYNKFVYLAIGLSAVLRSNGLINIGFPIYEWLKNWYFLILPKIIDEYKNRSIKKAIVASVFRTFPSFLLLLNTIFLSLVPFIFFQMYTYILFCTEYNREISIPNDVVDYALKNNLLMPGNESLDWCKDNLPFAYSKIQKKYWNVGFMKYYELKQIPNFVLALPILYIMIKCIFRYFLEHKESLRSFLKNGSIGVVKPAELDRLSPKMFVFIVHGLFLTTFSILFVHIQVSTRLLASASPLIYWYCAYAMSYRCKDNDKSVNEYEEPENVYSRWRVFFMFQNAYTTIDKCVLLYFLGYLVLGTFMYSNFLPWT